MEKNFERRAVIKSIGVGALAAGLNATSGQRTHAAEVQVPHSAGTEPAQLKAPLNACDSHHHIYDTRIPSTPPDSAKPDASVADYRLLQTRIGTSRHVVVTPSNYAFNNEVTVQALEQFGSNARGIAVINTSVTDAELKRLHDKGVRGIRVTMIPVTSWEDLKVLSKRVADLGWHVQFNIDIADVVAHEELLKELPTPVAFDHLARIKDVNDPALKVILRMLDRGKTWVKLSGVYVVEPDGAPKYSGAVAVAKTYAKAAPERVVWGSDWPHPSAKVKPDDALLFDLNQEWAPTESMRELILVRNPEALYGFERTALPGNKN